MKNIKQIVLSSLFALLITSNLMAQNTITKPFTIKAGYQQTNLDGDNIDFLSVDGKTTVLNSFLIGIAYHSEISKFISFKHELNFNINGAKVTLNDAINGDYQSTLRMNSLQLQPLNVTFRIKGFQVYVGTYTSALLHASIKRKDELENTYKDKSIFGDPDEETEQNKYLQKVDFGATAGILFQLNNTISLGVRYNHGLIPIFDNTTEQKSIKIYNKSWGVVFGYSL